MTDSDDTQRKDDLDALVTVVNVFREELAKAQKEVDRAQMTATIACWYGKRISEHLGVNTRDVDELVRRQDPELARAIGLRSQTEPPGPVHDPEAETDPFASVAPPKE